MRKSSQIWVAAAAVAGLGYVAWRASQAGGLDYAAAVFIGALGGVALYHASFGFTGSWRRFMRERRGAGMRAQLLLLAITVILSYPLIAYGREIGLPTGVWVFPVGVSMAIGAATFGFGMQLGGGCGSGTLFTVGGGSTRMVITLAAFIAGSVLWSGTQGAWSGLPRLEPVSFIAMLGAPGALALTLGVLGLLYWALLAAERARHGDVAGFGETGSALRGPWSQSFAAVILAAVIIATFLTLGRPWGITGAFPLWGAKIADAAGLPIRELDYWSNGQALARSVFSDATGVMNFGVMLGALGAAGLAGRFAPSLKLSLRDVATAVVGGLLMGYGARLAYGCNIGGFLGGVASASLHGWSWLLFGWIGSMAGVRARIWIGMDPPAPGVGAVRKA